LTTRFARGVRAELRAATTYYTDEAGVDVAWRFQDAVSGALELTPYAYARIPDQDGARHVLVRDFPYAVIFILRAGVVWVVAIAHASREPGYWRDRL
jgi:plasmid stabilization system protein ParE